MLDMFSMICFHEMWDPLHPVCIYIHTTSHVCGVGFVTEREAESPVWVPGPRTVSGFMMFSLTLRWCHSVMTWSVGWYRNHNKPFNTQLISYYVICVQKYVKNIPWCVVVCFHSELCFVMFVMVAVVEETECGRQWHAVMHYCTHAACAWNHINEQTTSYRSNQILLHLLFHILLNVRIDHCNCVCLCARRCTVCFMPPPSWTSTSVLIRCAHLLSASPWP